MKGPVAFTPGGGSTSTGVSRGAASSGAGSGTTQAREGGGGGDLSTVTSGGANAIALLSERVPLPCVHVRPTSAVATSNTVVLALAAADVAMLLQTFSANRVGVLLDVAREERERVRTAEQENRVVGVSKLLQRWRLAKLVRGAGRVCVCACAGGCSRVGVGAQGSRCGRRRLSDRELWTTRRERHPRRRWGDADRRTHARAPTRTHTLTLSRVPPPRQACASATRLLGTPVSFSSGPRVWWDVFVNLLIMFAAAFVPYVLALEVEETTAVAAALWTTDVLFMVDIVVNFRTTYWVEVEGRWVRAHTHARTHARTHTHTRTRTRREERRAWPIARRYLTSWFAIDLISTVPVHALVPGNSLSALRLLRVFRLSRLLKLAKLTRLEEMAKQHDRKIRVNSAVSVCVRACLCVCKQTG